MLSNVETRRIQELGTRRVRFRKGEYLVQQHEDYGQIHLIVSGWLSREKQLRDGRRVIVNFVLPGDITCLNALLFRRSAHSLRAVTAVESIVLPRRELVELFKEFPRLGFGIAWANACEEAMIEERVASLAARSAYERMAHLLVELWRRLELIGLAKNGQFHVPVPQADLADALGMSEVHVSRTLRALRRAGLIAPERMSAFGIRILDRAALEEAADFDDAYLHFGAERLAPHLSSPQQQGPPP